MKYNIHVMRYTGTQEVCKFRVEANDEFEARDIAARKVESDMDISWDFVDGWDLSGYDKEYAITPVKEDQ